MEGKINRRELYLKSVVLLSIIILVILKEPGLFTAPRFWAEEGAVYFAYAYSHGLWQSIIAPQFNYFSLFPNIASVLATLVPIEYAPTVTTILAFIFQVIPCAVVIYGNSPLWGSLPRRTLIAAGILLLADGEIWLTSIATQYWMTITVFLLLFEEKEALSRAGKYLYRSLVVLCGLSSPAANFLAPVYILKALRTKLREDWVHAALLSACFVFEAAVVVLSVKRGDAARFNGSVFDIDWFRIIELHFGFPFYGHNCPAWMPFIMFNKLQAPLSVAAAALFVYFIFLSIVNIRDTRKQLIIISILLVTVLTTFTSQHMASGGRYAFAPSAFIFVFMASELGTKNPRKSLAGLALIFFFALGIANYRDMNLPQPYLFYTEYWPKWPDEIAIWKADNGYQVRIWPQWGEIGRKDWSMELKSSDRK